MAKLTCLINSSYYTFYLFIMIITLNSIQISHSETPNYLKFVSNATTFPSEDYYDYIIVGGGTTGCSLAATLSEKYRVLVIERGGVPYGRYNVMNEDGFLALFNDVSKHSPVQPFVSEDGVFNARGRVLGGSSAINLGFYTRADRIFFETSGMEWDFGLVNQSYEWVEKEIMFEPELSKWQTDLRDALLHAGVEPYHGFTLDHVVGTKISGSTFDQAGKRHCAADLLSSYANPDNIRVAVYASAERILLDASNQAAIGVDFSDETGNYHRALVRENGEVLISAGALGSPQLLLLSGIGPSHYLSSKGIQVAHHSPYVGRFMYDNPRIGVSIVSPIPLDQSKIKVVGVSSPMTYIEGFSNIVPVIEYPESPPIEVPVATIVAKIGGPDSSGSLRLASRDVRKNPIVKFNYYSSPTDLHRCMNNTLKLVDLLSSPSLRDYKVNNTESSMDGPTGFKYFGDALPPVDQLLSKTGKLEEFCRSTVGTMWHHHGGCLVGKVVDEKLRVMGIDSLRVVDASPFRVAPGTNPQATLMMLGRYIGLQMLNQRMGTSSSV